MVVHKVQFSCSTSQWTQLFGQRVVSYSTFVIGFMAQIVELDVLMCRWAINKLNKHIILFIPRSFVYSQTHVNRYRCVFRSHEIQIDSHAIKLFLLNLVSSCQTRCSICEQSMTRIRPTVATSVVYKNTNRVLSKTFVSSRVADTWTSVSTGTLSHPWRPRYSGREPKESDTIRRSFRRRH